MTQPAPTTKHALVEEVESEEASTGEGGGSGGESGGESTGTVVLAGAVNLAIAAAKLVGGLISHSSAMMSEAAHSLADTVTEVLLFIALKRGNRAADERHPFGYGRETYFWAFLAALCTFGVGAGFSIWQGVQTIIERKEEGSPTISYIVLAVSFVLEGSSLVKAVRQVRSSAREHNISSRQYLRHTTDTTVKAVTFEDSAALVGLVLAALGLFLEQITGDPLWDGISAVLIGVLLILVAGSLARANISLLIGQSVPGTTQQELKDELSGIDQVDDVPFLLTTVIGPGQLLVAAKVDFADTATVADIERASDEAERRLVARHPGVRYVFLDPTPGDGKAQVAAPAGE
jgi:cation diffusion facilitator family transporter